MRICRTVGTAKLRNLDPFLMLDELRMPSREATAGFPDHPHRGFETCSIMFRWSTMTLLATRRACCQASVHVEGLRYCRIRSLELSEVTTPKSRRDVPDCTEQGRMHVQGVIGPGGVQWMTAGRGIVHSEMPKVTQGDLWGFQLWINLPAKDKMVKPR